MQYAARFVLTLALTGALAPAQAEPLVIDQAWVRATPPGARAAAAYLTIENGATTETLIGAVSPAAREVQIHTHVNEAGVHKMVRLPELALPASGSVQLAPGGLHLMLIDLAAPLAAGQTIQLRLEFASTSAIELTVPVVDARAPGSSNHTGR